MILGSYSAEFREMFVRRAACYFLVMAGSEEIDKNVSVHKTHAKSYN